VGARVSVPLRSYAPVCDEKNDINFLFTKQKSNWFKAIKIQTNKKRKNNNNTYCRPAFLSSNHGWLKQNHYFNIFRC
jgi:hypothetical protein